MKVHRQSKRCGHNTPYWVLKINFIRLYIVIFQRFVTWTVSEKSDKVIFDIHKDDMGQGALITIKKKHYKFKIDGQIQNLM